MVFAERREGNVAHHDHLVVSGLEANVKVFARIALDARKEFAVHLGDASRGLAQSFTRRVFTDRFEQLANQFLHPRLVNHA
jgi:hypothetical protein